MSTRPSIHSDVKVTTRDGEVREYRITASPNIASYLVREAASSGFISIRNDDEQRSWLIPIYQIIDVEFTAVDPSVEMEQSDA